MPRNPPSPLPAPSPGHSEPSEPDACGPPAASASPLALPVTSALSALWGFRDGALLCLVTDPSQIPDWATVRYSFASASELVFAAHYVPLVRSLDGDTIEGITFTSHDAQKEFRRLTGRVAGAVVDGAAEWTGETRKTGEEGSARR